MSEIAGLQLLIVEHVEFVSGCVAPPAPRSTKRQTRRMRQGYVVDGLGWREKGTGQMDSPEVQMIVSGVASRAKFRLVIDSKQVPHR